MSGRSFRFWSAWLQVALLAAAAAGVALALAPASPVLAWITGPVERVFWPDLRPPAVVVFQHWIYAVLGATMAAWALMAMLLARHAFRHRERWARDIIAAGLALWFALDTGASAAARVWPNVAFNAALLALLALPLAVTWVAFEHPTADSPYAAPPVTRPAS